MSPRNGPLRFISNYNSVTLITTSGEQEDRGRPCPLHSDGGEKSPPSRPRLPSNGHPEPSFRQIKLTHKSLHFKHFKSRRPSTAANNRQRRSAPSTSCPTTPPSPSPARRSMPTRCAASSTASKASSTPSPPDRPARTAAMERASLAQSWMA